MRELIQVNPINNNKMFKRKTSQRQILSLMGIDCWVSNTTLTVNFSEMDINKDSPQEHKLNNIIDGHSLYDCQELSNYKELYNCQEPETLHNQHDQSYLSSNKHGKNHTANNHNSGTDNLNTESLSTESLNAKNLSAKSLNTKNLITKNLNTDKLVNNPVNIDDTNTDYSNCNNISNVANINNDSDINNHSDNISNDNNNMSNIDDVATNDLKFPDNTDKVQPFQLKALQYQNWILLVDFANVCSNSKTTKLWDNICQTLTQRQDIIKNSENSNGSRRNVSGKNIQTLKFPLIAKMDTVALANASLSGFIFRISKNEQIKLGVLTTLVKGLDDKRIVNMPSLQEMIEQPILKAKFWHILHDD